MGLGVAQIATLQTKAPKVSTQSARQDLTYGLTDGWWMLTDTERPRIIFVLGFTVSELKCMTCRARR